MYHKWSVDEGSRNFRHTLVHICQSRNSDQLLGLFGCFREQWLITIALTRIVIVKVASELAVGLVTNGLDLRISASAARDAVDGMYQCLAVSVHTHAIQARSNLYCWQKSYYLLNSPARLGENHTWLPKSR
jgi:hypothetical protein